MKRVMLLICCCLWLLPVCALAEATTTDMPLPMAEDITQELSFKGGSNMHFLTNGGYGNVWSSVRRGDVSALTIIAPEGKTIGTFQIYWRFTAPTITIQAPDGEGGWTDVAVVEGKYDQQLYTVDNLSQVRIFLTDTPRDKLEIYEVKAFTQGQLPEYVHIWQDAPEKVDMMLVHGHADDEVLWFGGLLPTYAAAEEKDVLVVASTPRPTRRKHELLDSLWTCGVRIYPVLGEFPDQEGLNMQIVLKKWGEENIISFVTEQFRKYKPDVVVTHDINGEYGHCIHKALSYACREALVRAADETFYPETAALYGVWNIPKMYIHLYEENQISMDWWQPLECFGGKTAQDVAREGFACHKSQQGRWEVKDYGEYDNSLFGLYHTTVGLDVVGGDMFENID